MTEALANRGTAIGIDLSWAQLGLCRSAVGSARLVQADMAELRLRPGSLDLVTAFYSLTHVPRDHLGPLLRRMASWLRPGGAFVGSFGAGDDPGSLEEGWLGQPMYFSGHDVPTTLGLLDRAGFVDVADDVVETNEHGRSVRFLWVTARTGPEPVELRTSPAWRGRFEEERRVLTHVYGPDALGVEHVGSTAVPGISAKPIVDVLVGLRSLDRATLRAAEMERQGYDHWGELGLPGRHFFGRGRPRTANVHVVEFGGEQWRRHIVFRDALRADPELVRRYGSLKVALAARFPHDRDAYTDGKSSFIEAVLASAANRDPSRAAVADPDGRLRP